MNYFGYQTHCNKIFFKPLFSASSGMKRVCKKVGTSFSSGSLGTNVTKNIDISFLRQLSGATPLIKLFDSSSCGLARSCEKLKSLSLLLKSLWPRKLVGWWLTLNGFYPWPFTHDPLVTWSCEITWQTETVIYSLPHCLLPPNLPGWRLTLRGSYHKVTWPLIRLSS